MNSMNREYYALKTRYFLKQEYKVGGQKATGSLATNASEE